MATPTTIPIVAMVTIGLEILDRSSERKILDDIKPAIFTVQRRAQK
jgi:hypothetical protein